MTSTLSPMAAQRSASVRTMLVTHAAASPGPQPAIRPSALALAGAVAVTVVLMLAFDPAAPPSYADWTAVPDTATEVPSRDLEAWASRCSDLRVGGVRVEGVPARPDQAAQRTVLVDRRGSFTYCVDVSVGSATPADPLIALAGLRADGGRARGLNTMSTTVSDRPFVPPTGGDLVVLGGNLQSPPSRNDTPGVITLDIYQVFGLVGPEVTGVDIVLVNGLRVTATVHKGLWGAWWPANRGDPAGSQLDIRTGAGSRTVDPRTVQLTP